VIRFPFALAVLLGIGGAGSLPAAQGGDALPGDVLLVVPVPAGPGVGAEVRPVPKEIQVLTPLTIRKGDTLWRLSKKKLGKGGYYPQLLLVNPVKDPDRIFVGKVLWIPSGTLERHPDLAARLSGKTTTLVFPGLAAASSGESAGPPAARSVEKAGSAPGGTQAAVARGKVEEEDTEARMIGEWARQEQCGKLLPASERFLVRHPESSQLVSVLWQQAECYRKLSGSTRPLTP
jgi:hypothetical protein